MWFIVAFALMFLLLMIKTYISRKRMVTVWNPFKLWEMITLIRRKDNSTFERPFKRFEYVNKETEEGVIIGIYFVQTNPKSKKELKYEEMVRKWK